VKSNADSLQRSHNAMNSAPSTQRESTRFASSRPTKLLSGSPVLTQALCPSALTGKADIILEAPRLDRVIRPASKQSPKPQCKPGLSNAHQGWFDNWAALGWVLPAFKPMAPTSFWPEHTLR